MDVPHVPSGSLPDLASLSDDALYALLQDLLAQAEQTPDDRLLLGRIDILRAEIVARGGDPFAKSSS